MVVRVVVELGVEPKEVGALVVEREEVMVAATVVWKEVGKVGVMVVGRGGWKAAGLVVGWAVRLGVGTAMQ